MIVLKLSEKHNNKTNFELQIIGPCSQMKGQVGLVELDSRVFIIFKLSHHFLDRV